MQLWAHINKPHERFADPEASIVPYFDRLAHAGFDHVAMNLWDTDAPAVCDSSVIRNSRGDILSPAMEAGRNVGIDVRPAILPFHWQYACGVGESPEAIARRTYQPDAPLPEKMWNRLCPSWRENRDVALRLVEDLCQRYSLSGLHLDACRYLDDPELRLTHPCQCEACTELYQTYIGKDKLTADDLADNEIAARYAKARQDVIHELLTGIHAIAQKHGFPLSMDARGDYTGKALLEGQDWVQWARKGYMNMISPMVYTTDREAHHDATALHAGLIGKYVDHVASIGRNWGNNTNSTEEMIAQAEDALRQGVDGLKFWNSQPWTDEDIRALKTLKESEVIA